MVLSKRLFAFYKECRLLLLLLISVQQADYDDSHKDHLHADTKYYTATFHMPITSFLLEDQQRVYSTHF